MTLEKRHFLNCRTASCPYFAVQLGSAEILVVLLPAAILQDLLAFFTRTLEDAEGFGIDAPFDLPAINR